MIPISPRTFSPLRVLVAGCGYVGGALAARLAREGHIVWGLRRSAAVLPAGVRSLTADLDSAPARLPLPPPLDHVVYAVSPDDSSDAAYATYADRLANLLAALREQRQSPQRVLLTSSTGVYGQQQGEWVDEESPTEPARPSGKRLLAAEHLLLGSGFPATVLRLGGIYGPGRERLIEQVRSGTAVCQSGFWSNRIHRDDCARALHHLMTLAEAAAIYIGVDREPAELCTVQCWLAERLGAPPPRALPADPRESARRTSNKRCSSARLVGSGYRFLYPTYREGFAELLKPA